MERVYLDTDCVLALVKDQDWLKGSVLSRIKNEDSLVTSVLTVVEMRLVLLRDMNIKKVVEKERSFESYQIELIPFEEDIQKISLELMSKYEFLTTFDAVHAATAISHQIKLISTDRSFPRIKGLLVEDPRRN